MGVDLGGARGAHRFFDFLGEHRQVVLAHGTALARLAHTVDNVLTVERLRDTGALDHRDRRGFQRGEAAPALRALAAAADRRTVVGGAGIDHLGVIVSAERAVHGSAFPAG